jgi:hypothetical protein
VERGEAGHRDPPGGRERRPPGRPAGDAPDERGVLGGRQTGRVGLEAREALELHHRPRDHEAPVGVEIRLAPVVDPAVVPEGEGVHPEPQGRTPGGALEDHRQGQRRGEHGGEAGSDESDDHRDHDGEEGGADEHGGGILPQPRRSPFLTFPYPKG